MKDVNEMIRNLDETQKKLNEVEGFQPQSKKGQEVKAKILTQLREKVNKLGPEWVQRYEVEELYLRAGLEPPPQE